MRLVEILIALFIIGILSTISVTTMLKRYSEHANDTRMIDEVLLFVRSAQDQASVYQKPIGIRLKNQGHSLQMFIDDVVIARRDFSFSGTLTIRSYPWYRNYLQFQPEHRRVKDNGTIWYCAASAPYPAWVVSFNRYGESQVRFPDKHGVLLDTKHKPYTCP